MTADTSPLPESLRTHQTAATTYSRPDQLAQRTARSVAALFLLCVLLQRFAVPASPVALLLPVVLAWCAVVLARGLAVVDRYRAGMWLAGFGVTALVIPFQERLVSGAIESITSWGLFMVVWAPAVLRLVDRRVSTFRLMLAKIASIGVWLAAGCIVMTGTQLAGMAYQDWFHRFIPDSWELSGYVITYPIYFGSDIVRANAWIGLEPSMVSLQIGLSLIAAIYAGVSVPRVAVIALGLACTFAGSGLAIVGVGVLIILVHPVRHALLRYVPIALGAAAMASTLSVGSLLLERATESRSEGSSTSLRAIAPYREMWPIWVHDTSTVLLGKGAGSSQELVSQSNISGLLVSSPIKVFFDYGLLAGAVLAAFLLSCYVGGPSRAFSMSLLVSLWILQPGTTTILLVAPLLIFVTFWSPRVEHPLDLHPSRGRTAIRPVPPRRTFLEGPGGDHR